MSSNRYHKQPERIDVVEPVTEEKPVVKVEAKPAPKIKLKAGTNYHNAAIAGGVGVYWRAGEVREVDWEQYQQLLADNYRFERVG